MADYYTELSFIVECKQGDQALLLRMLEEKDEKLEAAGESSLLGNCFEKDDKGVWIRDEDGHVEIDALCDVLQAWLGATGDECMGVGFEWSNSCSKHRLDAFGGGAVFIRKDDIQTINTGSWLHEKQVEEL